MSAATSRPSKPAPVSRAIRFVVNGAKRWCTGADWADYIYCLVNSDPNAPKREALSFLLIPPKSAGITITPIEHANLRYTASCDVHFDDVRLPLSAIVGGREKWRQGWKMLAGRALDVEKLEVAAVTFGIAQAAVEEAWQYAQERVQFGKPIAGHQAIRHKPRHGAHAARSLPPHALQCRTPRSERSPLRGRDLDGEALHRRHRGRNRARLPAG